MASLASKTLLSVLILLLLVSFYIMFYNMGVSEYLTPPISPRTYTMLKDNRNAIQRPSGIKQSKGALYRAIHKALLRQNPESQTKIENLLSRSITRPDNTTNPKVILVYTSFFGELPWSFLNDKRVNTWNGAPCPYQCRVTHDKSELKTSDAVLFHARNMPSLEHLREMIKTKPPTQRWVYFILESPVNTAPPSNLNGIFNWTMTYSRDSDIVFPYGEYYPLYELEATNATLDSDFAKGRDHLIVWTVSHCGTIRDKFVKKLMEHVPINVYGACASGFPKRNNEAAGDQCSRWSKECDALMRRHKFRLSFENSICVDYVTEKYWNAIDQGTVPIVLGGANYDHEVAIPGSYINALDFPNMKALADYIKYLDKNDTAYNEYLAWKKKFKYKETWTDGVNGCTLCTSLHLNQVPKVYNALHTFWGIDTKCDQNRKDLSMLIS